MNIKKIIHEVVDDFDWAKDIKPFNLNGCGWVIETTNGDEWTEVEQFMFDSGWVWGNADEQIHADYEGRYHFFFPDDHSDCDDTRFDAADEGHFYNGRNELLNEWSDSKFMKWSDIRKQVMNESDDFEWAKDIPKGVVVPEEGMTFTASHPNHSGQHNLRCTILQVDKYGITYRAVAEDGWSFKSIMVKGVWKRKVENGGIIVVGVLQESEFEWTEYAPELEPIDGFINYIKQNSELLLIKDHGDEVLTVHNRLSPNYEIFRLTNGVNPFNLNYIIDQIDSKLWYAKSREVNLGSNEFNLKKVCNDLLVKIKKYKKLNESNDFDWAKDVPGVDIYKPQVGYIYHWKDYRDMFLGPDDDGPLSDEIVIKNIDYYEHRPNVWKEHTVYEFDTVNNYWGNTHLDGIDSRDFIRMIKNGTITFIQES